MSRGRTCSSRLAVLLTTFLLLGASPPRASAADPPETVDPSASCSNSDCHTDVAGQPHVHWSDFTKTGECQKCHEPEGDLHEFSIEDPPDLCVGCHEEIAAKIASLGANCLEPSDLSNRAIMASPINLSMNPLLE